MNPHLNTKNSFKENIFLNMTEAKENETILKTMQSEQVQSVKFVMFLLSGKITYDIVYVGSAQIRI